MLTGFWKAGSGGRAGEFGEGDPRSLEQSTTPGKDSNARLISLDLTVSFMGKASKMDFSYLPTYEEV